MRDQFSIKLKFKISEESCQIELDTKRIKTFQVNNYLNIHSIKFPFWVTVHDPDVWLNTASAEEEILADRMQKRNWYIYNSDENILSTFCMCHQWDAKSLFALLFPTFYSMNFFLKKTSDPVNSVEHWIYPCCKLPKIDSYQPLFFPFWSFHKEKSVGIYLFPYSSSTLQWNNEKINSAMHQRQSSKEVHFPVLWSCAVM